MQVVVFSLKNQRFGISTSQVQEIIRYQDVEKIAGMPDYMEGMINLRGKVIPIIDLHLRFKVEEVRKTDSSKIVISDVDSNSMGFTVDDVDEIITFSDEEIETIPAILQNSTNAYLKCIAKKSDKLVSIIDPSRILTSTEVEEVIEQIQ